MPPTSAPRAAPPRPADAPDAAAASTTPPRPIHPPSTVGGVSPDSRFVHTYAMHDAPITFGLDTPPALGRAAAEGLLAAHAANGGGGGGRGGRPASVLGTPAPSATPPRPSPRHTGHLIASGPPPPTHTIAAGPPSPTLASPDESPPRRGGGSVLAPPPLLGDDGGMATSLDATDDAAGSGSRSGDEASAVAAGEPPARAAGGAATAPTTTTTRPWPLAAPKGTWLYDVTLAGASPAAVRAALADPSFAARVLASRCCTDVDVGPWSPPASTPTPQRRTLRYTAPVAGGVLGGQRVACVEAQVVTPLGGAAGPTRSPHRFTLTITATTPELQLYGGAFECEIVVTGDAAAGEATGDDAPPPTSTQVTAFGRVLFKKKLPMVRRMLEVNAVAGLKAAYAVHAAELASFLAAPSTATAAPGGGSFADALAAIAARLAADDTATLAAISAAALAVALAVALASVAAAVNGVRAELAAARRDLAAIAVAAAKVAARQCK